MNYMNKKNKNNVVMSVVIVVAILLLAVAVSAALTQGFTNANPYGWLDKTEKQENEIGTLKVGDEITGAKLQTGSVDVAKLERAVANITVPKACSFEGDDSSLYSGMYIRIEGSTDSRIVVIYITQYHYSVCFGYNPNEEPFVVDPYRGYVLEPNKWYMWISMDTVSLEFKEVDSTMFDLSGNSITVSDEGCFELLNEIIVPIHAEADAE